MARKPTLLEEMRQHLPRKGTPPWHEMIDPEIREELLAIKRDFFAGKLGPKVTKTGLAAALSKTLTARGITVGPWGVQRWLDKN